MQTMHVNNQNFDAHPESGRRWGGDAGGAMPTGRRPPAQGAGETTVIDREIGRRLRAAMLDGGVCGKDMARLLGKSQSMISRWLTGALRVSLVDAAGFLVACRRGGPVCEPVLRLIGDRDRGLPTLLDRAMLADATILYHLGSAVSITEYGCMGLPLWLQTVDYARAHVAHLPDQEQADWLAVHAQAVDLLTHDRSMRIAALLHEGVLRTPVGGSAVLTEQLDHLTRLSAWRRVSVRILPAGVPWTSPTPLPAPAFGIAEFGDWPAVVYEPGLSGLVLCDDPAALASHHAALDHLRRAAADEDTSRALLTRIVTDVCAAGGVVGATYPAHG